MKTMFNRGPSTFKGKKELYQQKIRTLLIHLDNKESIYLKIVKNITKVLYIIYNVCTNFYVFLPIYNIFSVKVFIH